jgi:hypothetical protein
MSFLVKVSCYSGCRCRAWDKPSTNKQEKTMSSSDYSVPVETSTAFLVHPEFPWLVACLSDPDKWGDQEFLAGGRTKGEWWLKAMIREVGEEAGGPGGTAVRLGRVKPFAVALDPRRDVRVGKTFGYVSEGRCPDVLKDIKVPFSYGCPDWLGFVPAFGTPAPNPDAATADGQAERIKGVFWRDVRAMRFTVDPKLSCLAAGHDVPVDIYRREILPLVLENPGEWIVDEPNDPDARISVIRGAVIIADFEQYRLEHFTS